MTVPSSHNTQPSSLPTSDEVDSPTSRRRSDQHGRTSRLARPKRGIARHDRGRDGGARRDGAECESGSAVTSYDHGGATGLADAVACGAGGCDGRECGKCCEELGEFHLGWGWT